MSAFVLEEIILNKNYPLKFFEGHKAAGKLLSKEISGILKLN